MHQESIFVEHRGNNHAQLGNLMLWFTEIKNGVATIIIGRPGVPNFETQLRIASAVYYETPDEGMIEVRLMGYVQDGAEILLSQISPSTGMVAGYTDQNPENTAFTREDITRIENSVREIKDRVLQIAGLSVEQQEIISRKLDYIVEASERVGRKDWKVLVIGTLSSVIVSSSIETEQAREIFAAVSATLSWLYESGIQLLQ